MSGARFQRVGATKPQISTLRPPDGRTPVDDRQTGWIFLICFQYEEFGELIRQVFEFILRFGFSELGLFSTGMGVDSKWAWIRVGWCRSLASVGGTAILVGR